jgi:hypothetical protein
MKKDFHGDVYIGSKKIDSIFIRSMIGRTKKEREINATYELLTGPDFYELAWKKNANGLYDIKKGFRVRETTRNLRKNPMEYDVLSDKYIVTGSPYRDRMKALLTHIYAMRDAGKSQAAMKPFIKEYKNLKRIVTPLRSNPGSYQHPHFAELKNAGFYDVLHNIEYGGNPMDVSLEKWKKAERLLGKVPYGSTLRPLIAHRIRYVKRQQDKELYGNPRKGHRTHGLI